jgi:phosphatidylglycerol lysyltransferase
MHGGEKRFSLGWFDDAYLRNGPVLLVRGPDGRSTAFANLVPEYQLNELTLDLMRHRRDVEHGTMDFLFVRLFEWARERGYASFNLGLSPLAGVGERSDDPAVERALHYLYEHVDRFYNFKGLRQFKEKFHPHWEPRYLVHPGAPSLLAVAAAVLRADSGDEGIGGYLKDLFLQRAHPRRRPAGEDEG